MLFYIFYLVPAIIISLMVLGCIFSMPLSNTLRIYTYSGILGGLLLAFCPVLNLLVCIPMVVTVFVKHAEFNMPRWWELHRDWRSK